jgi:hypothetical protein
MPKYFQFNLHITEILDNQGLILQTILDPMAFRLPASIKNCETRYRGEGLLFSRLFLTSTEHVDNASYKSL